MGCYLSAPDDRVYITEDEGKNIRYATASCQGWRREQEDAEDCLLQFDDDANLFILCDGHGGSEVAKYTVEHFPKFLKEHKQYKDGNYAKALEDAFIEFDQHLRTPAVLEALDKLSMDAKDLDKSSDKGATIDRIKKANHEKDDVMDANDDQSTSSSGQNAQGSSSSACSSAGPSAGPSTSSGSTNGPSSVVEDVDTETLRREAHIPIEELITKYTGPSQIKGRVQSLRHKSLIGGSPVIRSSQRDDKDHEESGEGSNREGAPSTSGSHSNDQAGPSKSQTFTGSSPGVELIRKAMEQYFKDGDEDDEDDDDDSEFDASETDDEEDDDEEGEDEEDHDESDSDDEDDEDDDGDDECEDMTDILSKSKRLRKKHQKSALDGSSSNSDSAGDDEFDEEDDDEDDDDEEDREGSDGEVDDDDEDDEKGGDLISVSRKLYAKQLEAASRIPRAGIDSGCTVVVALVKSGTLYVASAGDSRCIVIMKNGQHKAMSFDHKPEDHIEIKRIEAANGTVQDGRVNGGLNLSRAFGDFYYKDADLDPRKQMITALPDVKTLELNFDEVEFIFLACDGIWNSMSNAKVAGFIHERISSRMSLVDICMALFRNCLAGSTDGDGTGCDNMTCILVKYYKDGEKIEESQSVEQNNDLKSAIKPHDTDNHLNNRSDHQLEDSNQKSDEYDSKVDGSSTGKRSADSDDDRDSKRVCKRRCLRLLAE